MSTHSALRLGLLMLLGCRDVPSTEVPGGNMKTTGGLTLVADFRITGARLEIPFTVENETEREVYLIDLEILVQPHGETWRPAQLMVGYEPPETAVLASKLLPLNPDALWAVPPGAYTSPVAPGEKYRNTLTTSLPLRAKTAQIPGDGPHFAWRKARFELGVIRHSPEITVEKDEIGGKSVCRVSAEAWRHQEILTVESSDLSAELILEK